MAKYLITGITGHLAPHLAKLLLSEGHEVHGTLRGSSGREYDLLDILTPIEIESINFHYLDLRDFYSVNKLAKNNFDGIFHLASQSHPAISFKEPLLTWESNVMGSINLFTAIQGSSTKIVVASTSEVYGDQGKDVEILYEEMPLKPNNPYGASKAAMDLYLQERITNGFINGIILRPFSHCAPRRGKIFSISSDAYQLAKIALKLQEPILKIGNLNTERVVIDARDVAKAYYMVMVINNLPYKIFNICGGKDRLHSMQFYTDTLIKLSGVNVNKEIYKPYYREIDIQRQWGSSDRIRSIGWEEKIFIEKTLLDIYEYWIKKLS